MSRHHANGKVQAALRTARRRIQAGPPIQPCRRCGAPIVISDAKAWDAGHVIPVAVQVAQYGRVVDDTAMPEHVRCNRSAGGRAGAAHTNHTHPAPARGPDLHVPGW